MFNRSTKVESAEMKSKHGGSSGGGAKGGRKIDRRSSRGVMFENEGLRMRSIDINAEVEKGHSDLRKLKKENETLKQQVWTLRDEYDKLETMMKAADESSESTSSSCDDDESTDNCCSDSYHRRHSNISRETIDGVDLIDEIEMNNTACSNSRSQSMHRRQNCGDNYKCLGANTTKLPCQPMNSPADQCVGGPEHFNLDQLLDFASSFHYDRRKHVTTEEPPTLIPPNANSSNTPLCHSEKPLRTPAFSSIRRRSATVVEQVSAGTSSRAAVIEEMKELKNLKDQAHSNQQNIGETSSENSCQTTTVTYARSSYYFANSFNGNRSQSLGTGLNSAGGPRITTTHIYHPPSSQDLKNCSSSLDAGLPLVSVYPSRTPLVRLSTIEPNTLMIDVVDMPDLWDITTQEIIDELEQQVGRSLPDIHGVRVAGRAAYISLGRREALDRLLSHGLTVRGNAVSIIDVTRESVVVGLAGVPHYIADGTLFILLAAFGTIIGEIERRFYKGVDTGERFVRIKLKNLVKLPKYVTVGGCRIILTVHERIGTVLPEWAHITTAPTHFTPSRAAPPPPPPSNAANSLKRANLDCTEVSKPERVVDDRPTQILSPDHPLSQQPIESTLPKIFSSRCVVNLKVPDRSSGAIPKVFHRQAPPPPRPTIIQQSPLSPGHVLRVGSLDRNKRVITTTTIPVSSAGSINSHTIPIPHKSNIQVKIKSDKNVQPCQQSTQVSQHLVIQQSPLEPVRSQVIASDGSTKPRSNSVAFQDSVKGGSQISSGRTTPLANGILRKPSMTQEQEALLPQRQTTTATIRSRLRLGGARRSVTISDGRQLGKMESISENTIAEDVNDITPLSSRSRRDSARSSVSGNSRSSSNTNRHRRDMIDLPWCGCWGNGCI